MKHSGAGMGGTPKGRSSACEQRDNRIKKLFLHPQVPAGTFTEPLWHRLPPFYVSFASAFLRLLRAAETGRYFVALSLAEAETLRVVLHRHKGTLPGLALRLLPAGGCVLDHSPSFREGPGFQRDTATQVLRFLDSEMYYSSSQVNLLLKVLQHNQPWQRASFLENMIACRCV